MHLRLVAVALVSLAYIVASHWLMTVAPSSGWSVVVIVAPMLAAVAVGAWRAGQRVLGLLAGLVVVVLCVLAALGMSVAPRLMYLAQHAGINLFLAVCFGATLRVGQTALITVIAARVHRNFTPAMAAYTRRVTLAWTLYFIAMTVLSLALYAFAPFEVWAVFANLLTPVAVVAMFGGEHLLRYWLHPEFERASVADAVRSYMRGTGAPATSHDSVV